MVLSLLTLFRQGVGGGGGGGFCPRQPLDVNNFFNIKVNVTKLGDFFKIFSGSNLI